MYVVDKVMTETINECFSKLREDKVMKTMVTILKSIFTPFSAFAFLLFGLLACFCSGMIEVYVLKEMLEVPGLGIDATSWAILIVLVLEGSKFTLHFYAEALKMKGLSEEIDEFDVGKKVKTIVRVKNSLIMLSVACSIICMINILYYSSDEKIDKYLQENAVYCDKKFDEGIRILDDKRKRRLKDEMSIYNTEKEGIQQKKDELTDFLNKIANEVYINRRQDLQEEANAMREQIEQSETTYSKHLSEVRTKVQEEYEAEYAKLEGKYGINGTERVTNVDSDILTEGDNPYLRSALNAFTKTFFGTGYSRRLYFLCVLFFSIVIAIVLEFCISISQMLLAIRVESFMKIIGEIPKLEKGKKTVRIVIWLMFSALIATAAYCIASIVLKKSISSEETAMALATYIITILLINVLEPTRNPEDINNMTKNIKTKLMLAELNNIFLDVLIPAVISFGGYILIGFIFQGDFVYGDMSGLAIAIGGAFSKLFRFNQCDFSI